MNELKFSDNLARLRREMRITQEELADFIGVTKAAVSKWENGQSMPDILLLPQLASYFGVTLDTLLGYEPQLSKEQIRRLILTLTAAFAQRPFDEVLLEVRTASRKYYACYPLLTQLCVLYLNHFFMAKDEAAARAVLEEARELCVHILSHCKAVDLCADAASLRAVIELQLGNTDAVMETLEPLLDPARISKQDDATLIMAYQMAGNDEKAAEHAQISMYLNLLSLVSTSVQYLGIGGVSPADCEETIRRVDAVAAQYQLSLLHPNVMAQFQYQAALFHMRLGQPEQALLRLLDYAETVSILLREGHFLLHGDDYFTRLDAWFETLALGPNPPRNKALVHQSALQSLGHPAFEPLRNTDVFRAMETNLQKE